MTNQNPYFHALSPDWIDTIYERYADSLEDVVLFVNDDGPYLGFIHRGTGDVGYDVWHRSGVFNAEGINYGWKSNPLPYVRPLTDEEFDSLGFTPSVRPAFNPADFGKEIPLDEVEKGDRVALVEANGDVRIITVEEVWIDRYEQTRWLNMNVNLSKMVAAYLIDRNPEPSLLQQAADYLNVEVDDLIHAIEKYNLKEAL